MNALRPLSATPAPSAGVGRRLAAPPSNGEDGDDAQIEEFCRVNHGVTFPLSAKIEVNGPGTHPVFAYLMSRAGGLPGSRIK